MIANKIVDKLFVALKTIIGALLLGSLVLLFLNIVLRQLNLGALSWVENMTIYIVMWIVFLGVGVVFKEDEHISMDFIYDFLPLKIKKVLDVTSVVLVIVTSGFITYYGFFIVQRLELLELTSTDGLVPLYLIYLSIPVGAIVSIIAVISNYVNKNMRKGEVEHD